jgi:hypothetical protein
LTAEHKQRVDAAGRIVVLHEMLRKEHPHQHPMVVYELVGWLKIRGPLRDRIRISPMRPIDWLLNSHALVRETEMALITADPLKYEELLEDLVAGLRMTRRAMTAMMLGEEWKVDDEQE